MLTTLIILTLRRYRQLDEEERNHWKRLVLKVLIKSVILLPLLMLSFQTHSQQLSLNYRILKNGSPIGSISINEKKEGTKTQYRLVSEVKTKFLFSFAAKGTEEAEYEDGVLKLSNVLHTLNGKEKVNRRVLHKGSHYLVNTRGKESRLEHTSIQYNMVCLYTREPGENTLIYSEKFNTFLSVMKLKDHTYRLSFPDGNYNEYSYEKGICTSVKVEHTLFSVTMELIKSL